MAKSNRSPPFAFFGVVLAVACLAPLIVIIPTYLDSAFRDDILTRARALIAESPEYNAHPQIFDELIPFAHAAALHVSYRSAGKSRPRALDEPKYVGTLYSELIRLLGERGYVELSVNMQEEWKLGKRLPSSTR